MALNSLTRDEERILVYRGTDRPFAGEYDKIYFYKPGT